MTSQANSSSRGLVALAIVVMVAAFAGGMWLSSRHDAGGAGAVEGLLWPDPPALPAFHLVDQDGQPFERETLRGHWSLLFFGFTHCPDVCPTTLAALARAQAELRTNPRFGTDGRIAFISVDPDRDTPEALAEYVHYFSPDFTGATASLPELQALGRALGVLFMKVEQADGDYSVDHSAGIFFISPDLHLVSVLTPPYAERDIVRRFDAVSAFVAAQG